MLSAQHSQSSNDNSNSQQASLSGSRRKHFMIEQRTGSQQSDLQQNNQIYIKQNERLDKPGKFNIH